MKRSALVPVVLLFCSVLAAAQGAPPKPAPELKKLDYFSGIWKTEAKLQPGPMGPGGELSSIDRVEWGLGHFFLVWRSKSSGSMGQSTEISYMGYDTEDKVYTYDSFTSNGEAAHSRGTLEGNTWTWTSIEKMGGKTMKGRFTLTMVSPNSYDFKFEIAPEGGDYSTVTEGKSKKVLSADAVTGAEGAATKK